MNNMCEHMNLNNVINEQNATEMQDAAATQGVAMQELTSNQGVAEKLPRLAMINSMAGFGRISTMIAIPVISAMQVQVCPVPTSILSNHLDFPTCYRNDYTPHMRNYINAWQELGFTFDGLYCGFLGSVEQMDIVEEFLEHFRPATFLLDPVMGDYGKAYSTITPEHCLRMKRLLAHADILTPNITEACLLTDTPYKEGAWSEAELQTLCQKLSALCPGRIVITGICQADKLMNCIWEKDCFSTYTVPIAGESRHGTGDLFASIIIASALRKLDFTASVKKASDFVALCIRGSEEMGLPMREGVPFEKYMHFLYN